MICAGAYGKEPFKNEHQKNQQADQTCAAQVRTTATWVHLCLGHGNPYTIQDRAHITKPNDSST